LSLENKIIDSNYRFTMDIDYYLYGFVKALYGFLFCHNTNVIFIVTFFLIHPFISILTTPKQPTNAKKNVAHETYKTPVTQHLCLQTNFWYFVEFLKV